MRGRNLFLYLLFSILFLVTNSVYSEQANQQKITVLLSTQTSDNTELYSFKDIINDSISFELRDAGFRVIIDKNIGNAEQLLQSANQQGASFLIESSYSIKNGSIQIDFNCYRTDANSRIFSTSSQGGLDLELDSVIKEAALDIITQIEQNIESRPLIIPESTGSIEEEEETIISEDKPADEDRSIKETEASQTVLIAHTPAETPVTEPSEFKHFTISIGFTPFMTTGKASNYFTFGIGPDLYTAYNFQTPFGYFGLGIYSSLIYFTAEGLLISSENLLISAGPEIRLGIDANEVLGIFLRLNSGATLFMLNKNNEGYKSAVIPFVSGGMGLTMNMTSGFGIIISANYSLYIENSILITGFSPSAGIYIRI